MRRWFYHSSLQIVGPAPELQSTRYDFGLVRNPAPVHKIQFHEPIVARIAVGIHQDHSVTARSSNRHLIRLRFLHSCAQQRISMWKEDRFESKPLNYL